MKKPECLAAARCAWVLALVVTGFGVQARAADSCDTSVLPQEIRTKLEKNYPDWQPERLEHLYDEDRQFWIKDHPNDCPGIAIGHFESKGERSYALLLISKPNRKRQGFRLVVFSRTGPSTPYVTRLVTKWSIGLYYQGSDEVIATIPPGRYAEAMGPKNVDTDLDTIMCATIEKGAALYYWKNGRYHELITSD